MAAVSIAFQAPENHFTAVFDGARPIDLVHLESQTMGDKELENEILQLFARNARAALFELAHAQPEAIAAVAHRLKGSAQAVGAVRVALAAEALENHSSDSARLAAVSLSVVEAENFILGLCR